MTEPTPQLHLPREHVMALTQILNQLSSTLAEKRRNEERRREQDERRDERTREQEERRAAAEVRRGQRTGRGAPGDDVSSVTPRGMTPDERGAFDQRAGDVPDPHPDHLVTAAVPLGEGPEWGVRASLPDGRAAHVVVPDATAATGLGSTLTQRNEPRDVEALTALTSAGSLAERLPDVPASVVEDPEWSKVEQRFRERVAGGADPDRIAEAVGKLDFTAARFPTSLASWEIDRVAEKRDGPGAADGPGRDADRAAAMSQLSTAEADARRERDEATDARRDQRDAREGAPAWAGDAPVDAEAVEANAAAPGDGEQRAEAEPAQGQAGEREDAAEQVAEHEGRAADAASRGETLRDGALARSLTPTPQARAAAAQRASGGQRYTPPKSAPTAAPTTPLGPRPQRRRFGR